MRIILASLFLVTSLGACSGGGGSGSTPPQVAAPPPNNAPTIELAAIPSSLDERQSFELDASQSRDPDGDSLTYQLAFSPADIARVSDASNAPNWIIETSEVTSDLSATLTVTVSDGRDSVSESLDFTILNYDRSPISSKWGGATDRYNDASKSDRQFAWSNPLITKNELHTLSRNAGDQGVIEQFKFTDDSFPTPGDIPIDLSLSQAEDFYEFQLAFAVGLDFVVHSKETGRVQIYRRDSNLEVSDGGEFMVADSCSIGATQTGDAAQTFPPSEPLGLVVGTPNGLTALLNNGSPVTANSLPNMGTFSESRIIATTGDFCELDFKQFNSNENARYFDETRGEINPIFSARGINAQFLDPISVTTPANMTLVDVAGGYMSFGSFFTAFLFAGETHDSDHQLSIVHQFFGPPTEQIDIPLPSGIPTGLYVAPIDSVGLESDIFVTVADTPYVYFFENLSAPRQTVFAPIEFIEVGFGVTQIDQIQTLRGSVRNYLVTNDGETLTMYPRVP